MMYFDSSRLFNNINNHCSNCSMQEFTAQGSYLPKIKKFGKVIFEGDDMTEITIEGFDFIFYRDMTDKERVKWALKAVADEIHRRTKGNYYD